MNARRGVSFVGRTLLSQAVSIDHDWSLSASSDDILQMESSAPSETHAGYPGSGLARCGAPIGALTVAPGEEFTCRKCQTPGVTR